jgi:hypothetical protein
MNAVSPMHAAWLVRLVCGRHVEEAPLNETGGEYVARSRRSCAALAASLGAKVNPIFMHEVIRLLEELHTVHAGTHPDLRQNAALTVNNAPDLIDYLQRKISGAVHELLAHTEPLTRRAEDRIPA